MEIKKGQRLYVRTARKGNFHARAARDFDTDTETFWPLIVDQDETVTGMSTRWTNGTLIEPRGSLVNSYEIVD